MARTQTPLIWGESLSGIEEMSRFHVPAGTVTFLLTDIEGSTRLWARFPDAMAGAVADCYAVLVRAIAEHDGVRPIEQGEGDSVVGAFSRASECAGGGAAGPARAALGPTLRHARAPANPARRELDALNPTVKNGHHTDGGSPALCAADRHGLRRRDVTGTRSAIQGDGKGWPDPAHPQQSVEDRFSGVPVGRITVIRRRLLTCLAATLSVDPASNAKVWRSEQ